MKTLLTETKNMLVSTDRTKREIADGAGVGKEWLNKFAQGQIKDPGINRVQAVHDYLSAA